MVIGLPSLSLSQSTVLSRLHPRPPAPASWLSPQPPPVFAPLRYTVAMLRSFCCVTQPGMGSGSSSLNVSREDLPVNSLDQSGVPPSFDSVHARDGYPTSPSPLSQSLATPESSLPSSTSSSTSSLPGYSDSLPVPGYRPNPTGSEQRLEFVPSRTLYGRSIGVWTKKIKDMTIALHNQDPVEIQHAPRYGRRGNILGTIEFDAESLANFEKVKLVVRTLIICAGTICFDWRLDRLD